MYTLFSLRISFFAKTILKQDSYTIWLSGYGTPFRKIEKMTANLLWGDWALILSDAIIILLFFTFENVLVPCHAFYISSGVFWGMVYRSEGYFKTCLYCDFENKDIN